MSITAFMDTFSPNYKTKTAFSYKIYLKKTAFSYKNRADKTAFSDKSTNKRPRNSFIPRIVEEKKLFLPS